MRGKRIPRSCVSLWTTFFSGLGSDDVMEWFGKRWERKVERPLERAGARVLDLCYSQPTKWPLTGPSGSTFQHSKPVLDLGERAPGWSCCISLRARQSTAVSRLHPSPELPAPPLPRPGPLSLSQEGGKSTIHYVSVAAKMNLACIVWPLFH